MSTLPMRAIRMFQALLVGAFFVPITLWATQHYPNEAHSTQTQVIVTVNWQTDHDATDKICRDLVEEYTGTRPLDGRIYACYDPNTFTIYAVEPKSFNDLRALAILGHEFWHALGAEHPE